MEFNSIIVEDKPLDFCFLSLNKEIIGDIIVEDKPLDFENFPLNQTCIENKKSVEKLKKTDEIISSSIAKLKPAKNVETK